MATVPLSGTNIRLLSGVPFSNDYKATRWFDAESDQTNWFLAKPVVLNLSQANFQRIEGYSFLAVNASIDSLWGTNYIMFQNASYNNKWFYGFVTKLEYKQHNTTYVHFEIDVLQTWMFDMTFKSAFVVREHQTMFNTDGSPMINTIDEGLAYGSEYRVVSAEQYRPYSDLYFLVVVSKQTMHTSSAEYLNSVNGIPQNMCFYVHPFRLDGSVPASNMTLSNLVGVVVNNMFLSTSATNNIVSMYITDALPDFPTYDGTTINFDANNYTAVTIGTANTLFVNNMPYGGFTYAAGAKYDGFTSQTESKLCMYPYRVIELVDLHGNKQVYKPEYIAGSDLNIDIVPSLGTSNKIAYLIPDYITTLTDSNLQKKTNMENALINNEPNDLPVMVDSLAAYIQGNRNSLQNAKNQIMFNGVMDSVGSGVGMVASAATDNPLGVVGSLESGIKGAGNAAFQAAALQAKQKDIANLPPSLAKMGSNSYFDYGNGLTGVWIVKKEIMGEYQNYLTQYFQKYGYKTNEVKIPNLHTRASWNYVETRDCVITGNFNNEDLVELKSIFDSGITLWHVDDIGNYTQSNGVI